MVSSRVSIDIPDVDFGAFSMTPLPSPRRFTSLHDSHPASVHNQEEHDASGDAVRSSEQAAEQDDTVPGVSQEVTNPGNNAATSPTELVTSYEPYQCSVEGEEPRLAQPHPTRRPLICIQGSEDWTSADPPPATTDNMVFASDSHPHASDKCLGEPSSAFACSVDTLERTQLPYLLPQQVSLADSSSSQSATTPNPVRRVSSAYPTQRMTAVQPLAVNENRLSLVSALSKNEHRLSPVSALSVNENRLSPVSALSSAHDGGVRGSFRSDPTQSTIRDAQNQSYARAANTDATASATEQFCEDCKVAGSQHSYCNVCRMLFCDICWSRQLSHRRSQRGIPHEKTEYNFAIKVQEVFTPDLTADAREKLHVNDIATTWFGVARDDNEIPLFRDYGRYADLINELKEIRARQDPSSSITLDDRDNLYPSLVSFVGETGAGKSTLIKFLIGLKMNKTDIEFPTPVVGAAGRDVATSEDVHLYLDPVSVLQPNLQSPLLFADCEGLEGGVRDPIATQIKKKLERQFRNEGSGGTATVHPSLRPISERELVWADSPKKRLRDYAVAHLYPRLLYTFSDVIVFVLKNPKVIEAVLERLVDWAQAALEKSSNQPCLPHAVIALNASEYDIDDALWDVETATVALMESLSRTVFHNPIFKKYAQFWRERHRQIESVEHLLLSYYSSIQVVRIPADGRPNMIRAQIEKLYDKVQWASERARGRKGDLRMLLDSDELEHYLQVGFDHFAEDLNTPFDFVQASFTNSPIPQDFGGNILKLAIQVMERWTDVPKGPYIFEELSYVVASCIMLEAARNRYRGNPDEIFPMYLYHIDSALENFCDRHWPCEYASGNGRCVNVRSGHGAKGHQLKSGKLLADGDYESSFTFNNYREEFQMNIYQMLVELCRRVKIRAKEGVLEDRAAADEHKDHILPQFIQHASKGDPKAFISHTVCFVCLFEPPEHALPCGHIICTPCLKTYGRAGSRNHYIDIAKCPMEKGSHWISPWIVRLKPESCGIRILTLDGGGIRGSVELEILKNLEQELGDINIRNFFDFIVGTSTGGIIALGLTVRHWTLSQCAQHFESLCRKAFTQRRGANVPLIGWIVENYMHSRYETHPLEEALKESFSERQYLFGGQREAGDSGAMDTKVAVIATTAAGKSVVLGNYNRLRPTKPTYQFQRPERPHTELRTWQAARATSAAPTYFKPFIHDPSRQIYSDGGIYHNNPIHVAYHESKLIWPTHQEYEPDILVSLGTGFCGKEKDKPLSRWRPASRGMVNHWKDLKNMAADHIQMSLDSERTWCEFIRTKNPSKEDRGRFIRINPDMDKSVPKLDDVEMLSKLKDITRFKVGSSQEIKMTAHRLVATCFYLEVVESVKVVRQRHSDVYEVRAFFQCRCDSPPEISEIGKFIKRHAIPGHTPHFRYHEDGTKESLAEEVQIDDRTLNRMVDQCKFRTREVRIRSTSQAAVTVVSLCVMPNQPFAISGCPRRLHGNKPTVANRHTLAAKTSFRWAGRSLSQQQRREWKPPTYIPPMATRDVLQRYSDPSHLLGSATASDLAQSSLMNDVNNDYIKTSAGIGAIETTLQHGQQQDIFAQNIRPVELDAVSQERNRLVELDAKFQERSDASPQPLSEWSVGHRAELESVEDSQELPTVEQQRYYIARDDWTAPGAIHLGLVKGAIVKILEKTPEGWWLGRLVTDPKKGYMPSEWLVPADADTILTSDLALQLE